MLMTGQCGDPNDMVARSDTPGWKVPLENDSPVPASGGRGAIGVAVAWHRADID